jgi:hypothetical protein
MITRAVLTWLIMFVGLLALGGFVLSVARSFSGRPWSNVALLRSAATFAFVGATVVWVLVVILD